MTKHIGFKRTKVAAVTSETAREYQAEENRYFRNMQASQMEREMKGLDKQLSAADAALADKHLPSKEAEFKMLERWEWGLTKSSRSGAFSKPGAGPAIFPGGMAKTMQFIDECTPGHFKEQKERPVLREQTRKVDVPPAAVTITDRCMDCMKEVDTSDAPNLVMSIFFIQDNNFNKHRAMGVQVGDIILGVEHRKCTEAAQKMGENKTRLVLVQEGTLASEKDIAIATRYGFPLTLHDGRELTVGQFYLAKRKDRLEEQMTEYLIAADKDSDIYRKNRKEVKS